MHDHRIIAITRLVTLSDDNIALDQLTDWLAKLPRPAAADAQPPPFGLLCVLQGPGEDPLPGAET